MDGLRKKRNDGVVSRLSSSFVLEGLESLSSEFFKSDYPEEEKRDGDETEISSLVSDADWRSDSEKDFHTQLRQKSKSKPVSLEKKWEQLQAKYEIRDKILARATEGKSEAYVRRLRNRERQVRELEQELLFLRDLREDEEKKVKRSSRKGLKYRKKLKNGFRKKKKHSDDDNKSKESRKNGSQLYESFVVEVNAFLPAVLCISIHSLAHIGYSDTVYCLVTQIQKMVIPNFMSNVNRLYEAVIFVLAVWLIWLSGDLVYFLNDRDFDCVKLDYHNQARLGTWRAKCLKWVRYRNCIRAHLFLIGWNMICVVVEEWHDLVLAWVLDQKESFLEDLPSRLYKKYRSFDDSFFPAPFRCSSEFERVKQEELEIWQEDVDYTSKSMSSWSALLYWSESSITDNELPISPLYGPWTEILLSVAVVITAIYVLRWYGYEFNLRE